MSIMSWRTSFKKLSAIGISSLSGVSLYFYMKNKRGESNIVHNSFTTNFEALTQWDHNWDQREVTTLVKPLGLNATPEKENEHNAKLEAKTSTAFR